MVQLNLTYLHCVQNSLFEHLFNLYWYYCVYLRTILRLNSINWLVLCSLCRKGVLWIKLKHCFVKCIAIWFYITEMCILYSLYTKATYFKKGAWMVFLTIEQPKKINQPINQSIDQSIDQSMKLVSWSFLLSYILVKTIKLMKGKLSQSIKQYTNLCMWGR